MIGSNPFIEAYSRLFDHFGPQGWWPGESVIEIVVGAVLTQNTNWENVRKAIANLQSAGLLDFNNLIELPLPMLAEYIRPSGYYNIKAKRLKNLLLMVADRYRGQLDLLLADEVSRARANLLLVQGIGPETADSILLYAGGHPVFVVDAYTHRVFSRHGLVAEEIQYHDLQEEFERRLPRDSALFNEFHALIVILGKQYCKKTIPLCNECPLRGLNGLME